MAIVRTFYLALGFVAKTSQPRHRFRNCVRNIVSKSVVINMALD